MPDPAAVRDLFTRVAPRYDRNNRVLSLGVDRSWRRAVLDVAGELRGALAVDVACGTGDLSRVLAVAGARVVGFDLTAAMVAQAPAKLADRGPALFARADALRLPVADGAADVATIAFGLRNLADRAAGLAELRRVVRPGGRVVVLEFGAPRPGPFGWAYRQYFTRVLPRVGGLLSGHRDAYAYLPETVSAWPGAEELEGELRAAGLERTDRRALWRGIAWLHWGRVPAAS